MFISFEGPDGSGKTTQSKLLADYFISQGKDVLWTREPGGCELGKRLRAMLLDDKTLNLNPLAELMLFCADRAQHVTEVIKPALAQNRIVICDRFIDSTTAYQAGGRGFSKDIIDNLNQYSTESLVPDITIIVDVPVDVGLARAGNRNTADKFEAESVAFHEKVRAMYRDISTKEPQRIKLFDGTQSIEAIQSKIRKLF